MKHSVSTSSLALILALIPACGHVGHEAAAAEPARATEKISLNSNDLKGITVEPVGEHSVDEVLTTSGRIAFDDLRVAHIFSPVTGRIVSLDAELGAKVKVGTPLARIASPDLGQASSDLMKANADLTAAEHDYKRKKELFDQNAESAAAVEQAEDAFRQARAERERTWQKARLLRSGKVDLVSQSYSLTSPIDGFVFVRNVNPGVEVQGQYANGGSAAELFTVGDIGKVWLFADVYESDLARVAVGAKVTAELVAYAGRPFVGTVDWISPSLDANTRTARVRCTFDNPDGAMKPEMYATAQISAHEKKLLAIRRTALIHMGDQTMVFVRSEKQQGGAVEFERLPVAVDETYKGDYFPVLHGLEAGDPVVSTGADTLKAKMAEIAVSAKKI